MIIIQNIGKIALHTSYSLLWKIQILNWRNSLFLWHMIQHQYNKLVTGHPEAVW